MSNRVPKKSTKEVKGNARSGSHAATLESIHGLAASLHALNQQAVREYSSIVEAILRSRSRDARHIEHTLDGLLGFCGHPPALLLYRRLCRHYFSINPVATAEYVHAYREMWDSEAKEAAAR
ncbi:MAG: hypothetical protein RL514_4615 [Verrucomicrobiota bacterium]|jgi:hypothetical protein